MAGLRHYGLRAGGKPKELGWQDPVRTPNGVRTEQSVDFGQASVTPLGNDDANAYNWAKARAKQGQSPFYDGQGLRPGVRGVGIKQR